MHNNSLGFRHFPKSSASRSVFYKLDMLQVVNPLGPVDSASSVGTQATMRPPSIGRSMSMSNAADLHNDPNYDPFPSSQMHVASTTLPAATEGRWETLHGPPLEVKSFQNRGHIYRSELNVQNKSKAVEQGTVQSVDKSFTTAYPITMLQVHAQAQPIRLNVVLCLDRSASMGPYMQKTIRAANTILHGLLQRVTEQKLASVHVTLLSFGSRVEQHAHKAPLSQADELTALCVLLDDDCHSANMGGTHIEAALYEATSRVSLDILEARKELSTEVEQAAVQGYVILLTDGEPTSGETCPLTIKQHLYNEYVGALPISFGAIALGTQPRRAFMEPLFEGGRFAFAMNEDGLLEAFSRITDGFDDVDRNLSLVVDGNDVVHGNISQSGEWVQVFDDLVHTQGTNNVPHKPESGLVEPPELAGGLYGNVSEASNELLKANPWTSDESQVASQVTDLVFAYTPWIYLTRGRKGAVDAPPRHILLCMILRFEILDDGAETPLFESPAAMIDHMALLEDQRLLQETVASAWKDPTEARRVVNTIAERAQMRSMTEPPSSASRWGVVRRMSTQASEWISPPEVEDASAAASGEEPRVKRMRAHGGSYDESGPPPLISQSTEMMSFDLCSQSTNS